MFVSMTTTEDALIFDVTTKDPGGMKWHFADDEFDIGFDFFGVSSFHKSFQSSTFTADQLISTRLGYGQIHEMVIGILAHDK